MTDAFAERIHLQPWDYPEPHIIQHTATPAEADGYGHINNSAYLRWLDECVWDHCLAVDMPPERCRRLDRGFAVTRHEILYLRAAYPGDELAIGNWVTRNDGKLRAQRQFQIIRVHDSTTLLRATSDYICTTLSTGKPIRQPPEFRTVFSVQTTLSQQVSEKGPELNRTDP
ncbi:MAG: thioesterase family protein [Pseudomonadota bacterium]